MTTKDTSFSGRECAYDELSVATSECTNCGLGLCGMCGYSVSGKRLCNACYVSIYEEAAPKENNTLKSQDTLRGVN